MRTSGGGALPGQTGVEEHWRIARVHCLRETAQILRNPADAEEAAQDALLRAWRHRGSARDSWAGWLRTIARNEALRIAASRRRHAQAEASGPTFERGEEDPRLGRVIDAVYLDGLMTVLPFEDRILLRLRYLHDLTQPEIAVRLGIPEGTVKVRLHRLRRRLREQAGGETP